MKDEIREGVEFLRQFILKYGQLNSEELSSSFAQRLSFLLHERYRDHWYEDKPMKGQAYRCLCVKRSENYLDPVLETLLREFHLTLGQLGLPNDFTLWIDPGEVSCRFGDAVGLTYPIARVIKDQKLETTQPETVESTAEATAGGQQELTRQQSLIVEKPETIFDEKLTAFIRQNSTNDHNLDMMSSSNASSIINVTTNEEEDDDLVNSCFDTFSTFAISKSNYLPLDRRAITPPSTNQLSSSPSSSTSLTTKSTRKNSSNIAIIKSNNTANTSRLSFNDSSYFSSSSSSCASSLGSSNSNNQLLTLNNDEVSMSNLITMGNWLTPTDQPTAQLFSTSLGFDNNSNNSSSIGINYGTSTAQNGDFVFGEPTSSPTSFLSESPLPITKGVDHQPKQPVAKSHAASKANKKHHHNHAPASTPATGASPAVNPSLHYFIQHQQAQALMSQSPENIGNKMTDKKSDSATENGDGAKGGAYCGYVESFPYYYKLNRLYNALALQKLQTDRLRKTAVAAAAVASSTTGTSPNSQQMNLLAAAMVAASTATATGPGPGTSPSQQSMLSTSPRQIQQLLLLQQQQQQQQMLLKQQFYTPATSPSNRSSQLISSTSPPGFTHHPQHNNQHNHQPPQFTPPSSSNGLRSRGGGGGTPAHQFNHQFNHLGSTNQSSQLLNPHPFQIQPPSNQQSSLLTSINESTNSASQKSDSDSWPLVKTKIF